MLKSNEQEQAWLKQLQQDLIQDRKMEKGNRSPLYYGLHQPYEQPVPDGYGDETIFLDPQDQSKYTPEQLLDLISNENKQRMDDEYIYSGVCERDGSYDIDDLSDFINYISANPEILPGNVSEDLTAMEIEHQYRLEPDALFLTRNAADTYLQRYGYNHPHGTVSYAMTAVRSPDFEHLLELLHNIDWDKSKLVLNCPDWYLTETEIKAFLKDYHKGCYQKTDETDAWVNSIWEWLSSQLETRTKEDGSLRYNPRKLSYLIIQYEVNTKAHDCTGKKKSPFYDFVAQPEIKAKHRRIIRQKETETD